MSVHESVSKLKSIDVESIEIQLEQTIAAAMEKFRRGDAVVDEKMKIDLLLNQRKRVFLEVRGYANRSASPSF